MIIRLQTSRRRGFVLLEIILAIGLFAIVATAMVAALDRLSVATMSARQEAMCLKKLESVITEIQHSRSFRTGVVEFPADGSGVSVSAEIAPELLANQFGQELTGLYRVSATARIEEVDHFSRTMEVVIYRS